MIRYLCVIGFTSAVLSCATPSPQEGHPIIQAYSNAYNEKNIETMAALMHPNIEWMSITGTEIEVHVSGKKTLAKEMQGWFEAPNIPKGSLRDWSVNGDYIAVTETASWTTDAGKAKSQSALTVYQLEGGLIRRVYYYPEMTD